MSQALTSPPAPSSTRFRCRGGWSRPSTTAGWRCRCARRASLPSRPAESRIWGYDGSVPSHTIEAARGQPVTSPTTRTDPRTPGPRSRSSPAVRRQRTRAEGHDLRQPQRDRRDRRPLHVLERPQHVPLPHPQPRRPRHDAPIRHHARRAHAAHEL